MFEKPMSRRDAMKMTVAGLAGAALVRGKAALAGTLPEADLLPRGAKTLRELTAALGRAPRHRNFKSVPMILTSHEQWDAEALELLMHYRGGPKQVWDNTNLEGPWLNLMRNSMNAQIWSYKHPDFLCVSATHGPAHFALYDEHIWGKYLAAFTKGKWKHNEWLREMPGSHESLVHFENPTGLFSPDANSISVLQERGAVFLACHNAIWELSGKVIKKGVNPDHISHEEMAAEFSNHLIPGVVLTPGIVATLPELQMTGFHYAT